MAEFEPPRKLKKQASLAQFFQGFPAKTKESVTQDAINVVTESIASCSDLPRPTAAAKDLKIKKKIYVRTVKEWQLELGDWLHYETVDGIYVDSIYCSICRAFPDIVKNAVSRGGKQIDVGKYIDGTSVVKKCNAQNHCQGVPHLRAKKANDASKTEKKDWRIIQGIAKLEETTLMRMKKIFNWAYFIAKEELPFTLFPSLLAVEEKNGVDIGHTYQNDKHARKFIGFMAELEREKTLKLLEDSEYFSVLFDGSTDRAADEKEQIYLRLIQNGEATMRFLGLQQVPAGTSEAVYEAIINKLGSTLGSEWKKHIVGAGADGCAVNFGSVGGVMKRMKDVLPWVVSIHCTAHKLELSLKDAFKQSYFEVDIDKMLINLYYFYHNSPKRWRELKKMAEILHDDISRPSKAQGTRWLDHRRRAATILLKDYGSIVSHLAQSQSRQDIVGAEKAKLKGWLNIMLSYKFPLYLSFYVDVLSPLSEVSKSFQDNSLSVPNVVDKVESAERTLRILKNTDGPQLRAFRAAIATNPMIPTFNGHTLTHVNVGNDSLVKDRNKILESIRICLKNRFSNFLASDEVLTSTSIFDPANWPFENQHLVNYGNKEIDILIQHFKPLLLQNGCEISEAIQEWTNLKQIIRKRHADFNFCDLWKHVQKFYIKEYPNIIHLIKIVLVFPLSTAQVERGFSCMNRIKTDWRCNLATSTLEDLMLLSLEGPSISEFDSTDSVMRWWSTGERSKRPETNPLKPALNPVIDSSESD